MLLVLAGAAAALADEDPWTAIETFREHLRSGGVTARFEQTFTPADFETGETESGALALSVPDCMRWDYDEPFPRSFLLCGDVLHYWNHDEAIGTRETIDAKRQPGLDLLIVDVGELQRRYAASLERTERGVEIALVPNEKAEAASAVLLLDGSLEHAAELSYLDVDGNETRFRIFEYRSGVEPGTFNPPDLTWEKMEQP